MTVTIGINGFGRIGRCTLAHIAEAACAVLALGALFLDLRSGRIPDYLTLPAMADAGQPLLIVQDRPAEPAPDVDVAVPVVQVSGSSDRSDAVVLEGATVAGEMFVFVAPQQGVSGVSFYLEDPHIGSPRSEEGRVGRE